jgi:hypothetical protein
MGQRRRRQRFGLDVEPERVDGGKDLSGGPIGQERDSPHSNPRVTDRGAPLG